MKKICIIRNKNIVLAWHESAFGLGSDVSGSFCMYLMDKTSLTV